MAIRRTSHRLRGAERRVTLRARRGLGPPGRRLEPGVLAQVAHRLRIGGPETRARRIPADDAAAFQHEQRPPAQNG
jgi:hypothetical protein